LTEPILRIARGFIAKECNWNQLGEEKRGRIGTQALGGGVRRATKGSDEKQSWRMKQPLFHGSRARRGTGQEQGECGPRKSH